MAGIQDSAASAPDAGREKAESSELEQRGDAVRPRTPRQARPVPDRISLKIAEGGIEVQFQDAHGDSFCLLVRESTPLRAVQKMLVGWLGLSFPTHAATLTKTDGDVFWDFNSEPFKDAKKGDVYAVLGELTGDMYFVDKEFRLNNELE